MLNDEIFEEKVVDYVFVKVVEYGGMSEGVEKGCYVIFNLWDESIDEGYVIIYYKENGDLLKLGICDWYKKNYGVVFYLCRRSWNIFSFFIILKLG